MQKKNILVAAVTAAAMILVLIILVMNLGEKKKIKQEHIIAQRYRTKLQESERNDRQEVPSNENVRDYFTDDIVNEHTLNFFQYLDKVCIDAEGLADNLEQAREYVLEFFNASPEEYVAIFTANASGALKLVGESYPFGPDDHYLLTFDNHNSVNGIREFARTRGAHRTYIPLELPDMRVDERKLLSHLQQARAGGNNLFAYPAQSNFSGVQHPLEWIDQAQAIGWDVLLDAAAFVPSNRLDLGRWKPNFVPISFYKMFGYPTGVGCLLARKDSLTKLHRPWFAGGTITVASVQGDKYYLAEDEVAFEAIQNHGGIAVAVGDRLNHSSADCRLSSPQAVRQWLRAVLDARE